MFAFLQYVMSCQTKRSNNNCLYSCRVLKLTILNIGTTRTALNPCEAERLPFVIKRKHGAAQGHELLLSFE
ncbi:hypothetical protein S23_56260 [Bradyrhizobium cosmicum]|uniref:Uncharacterized protein n=1 Tax=Bradyrhizobium cosmicum TaxID=1404864 RepID=A0AAI8QEK4_9BRAD|nr:hypothetical protein S23_56260 [Bradyrhizobium cosmicum]